MNVNGLCIEGSYNTAQYVLIVLTFAILVIATLLFYYPFYGNKIMLYFSDLARL